MTYTSINVSSNGNAQFTITSDAAFTNVCLPWTGHDYTIFPYWDDLRTDANSGCAAYPGGTCGIYTSVVRHCTESHLQHRMARSLLRRVGADGQLRAEVARGTESV